MDFKMARTTQNGPVSRIGENIWRKFACRNLLVQGSLWNLVMNVKCIAALSVLCVLVAPFTLTSLELNHGLSPLLVHLGPTVKSQGSVGMLSTGMPSNECGDSNGRAFHCVSDVNWLVAPASTEVPALIFGNPLSRFWGQSLPPEVMTLAVLWNSSGRAVVDSGDYNRFTTATSTRTANVFRNPVGDLFAVWFGHKLLNVCSLASGELLEPLTDNAEGNQQPSRGYTHGRFRDYRRGQVLLITGFSARVSLHTRHDIVRTLEKPRGHSSMTRRMPKSTSQV